jgi:hypothetical protein
MASAAVVHCRPLANNIHAEQAQVMGLIAAFSLGIDPLPSTLITSALCLGHAGKPVKSCLQI